MRLHRLLIGFLFVYCIFSTANLSRAQALADHVPADAMVYVGFKGGDSPGAGYDGSHLQAILSASDLPRLMHDLAPELAARLGLENRLAASMTTSVMNIGGLVWRRPGAFYFGGMDLTDPAQPLPRVAYILDGGDEAGAFASKLNVLLLPVGMPWRCRVYGSIVIISDFAMPAQIDHPLSADPQFLAAMKGTVEDPVIAAYVNGEALWPMLDGVIAQNAPEPVKSSWPRVRDELGLAGLNRYTMVQGFQGRDWATYVNLDYPAPRRGLFASDEPLPDELLHLIPKNSVRATAISLDLGGIYTGISHLVDNVADDRGAAFHQAEAQINQTMGFDVQRDLLGAFGTQWVSYLDPDATGSGMFGSVLLNRPHDAVQLSRYLLRAETVITAMAMPLRSKNITITFRALDAAGVQIHYLAVPLFAPSWAVKDGTLYVGLYPQVVEAALTRAPNSGSILDNPQFQKVRAELGNHDKMTALIFEDLPRTVPDGYDTWMLVSRLYLGMGDLFGVPTPPMVLPPLRKIMAELEPSGTVTWADDAGLHAKAITPFPGANIIGQGGNLTMVMVGEQSMLVSVLLPSLNRARETANRVKCANNLKQIGLALMLYTNEHRGAYPLDLGTLVATETLTPAVFCCPSTTTQAPPNLPADQAVKWVNDNSDYIYLGASLKRMPPPDMVIAYEKDSDHGGDGINMLFADGHVEFDTLPAAQQEIEKTKKALGL